MADAIPRPHTCEDCGEEKVALLVTDYGGRFCYPCSRGGVGPAVPVKVRTR